MRDQTIVGMQEANAKRSILLLKQFEFLQTRMRAFEQIIFNDRWALLRFMWDPIGLLRRVDNRQHELIALAEKQFQEARQKTHVTPISLATH